MGLKPEDYEKLIYIHSNRILSPKMFQKKFFSDKTRQRAEQLIWRYHDQGYVFIRKQNHFSMAAVGLKRNTIRDIVEKRLALIRAGSPVKVNYRELEHHQRVAALRVTMEQSPSFQDVFWVSDFEMSSGITREAKWNFRLMDVEARDTFYKKWELRPKVKYKRTADGYFEALINGSHVSFILEYEHYPYSYKRIQTMLNRLEAGFPAAFKLIVCANKTNSERMNRALWVYSEKAKKRIDRAKWLVAEYQDVISKPHKEAFIPILEPPPKARSTENSTG